MKKKLLVKILSILSLSVLVYAAEKMDIIIIDRQNSIETYNYIVPGFSTTNLSGTTTVNTFGNSASIVGNTTSTTTRIPSFSGSYQVQGATLTLKLPDNRIVVVNCKRKINWGHIDRYRSCRVPLTDNIQAEFKGDNVKLKWAVSLDGKKKQEETYKILGVFDAPTREQ
jgi:hypothetical protein